MITPQILPPTSTQQAALVASKSATADFSAVGGHHDLLVKQTEKWVSQTFYGTLLRQMRESPFHSDVFEGGNGGKAFTSLLDQRLADRMSRGAGGKLVNSIVRKIERAAAYQQSARLAKHGSGGGNAGFDSSANHKSGSSSHKKKLPAGRSFAAAAPAIGR